MRDAEIHFAQLIALDLEAFAQDLKVLAAFTKNTGLRLNFGSQRTEMLSMLWNSVCLLTSWNNSLIRAETSASTQSGGEDCSISRKNK